MASSFYDQVVRKTLDPGYRFVAQQLDNWGTLCTPIGGALSDAELTTFANGLKTYSTDPALALLVSGVKDRIVACCPAIVSPSVGGIIGNQVRRLTIDPGARRLAGVLDAMRVSCCSNPP
jgi:hypothetical protein